MKQLGDILLSPGPASEIVLGNTALVRGMIEAGTRVVTSYPGSPTPEIASAIASIDPDRRWRLPGASPRQSAALPGTKPSRARPSGG